jgi:hypothetical protein
MSNIEIILIAMVFVVLGFRLYQKYIKKDHRKAGTGSPKQTGSSFSSHSKDDDYEPYLKK